MFCQNCGTQLPDDARFCHECGAPTALVSDGLTWEPPQLPALVPVPAADPPVAVPFQADPEGDAIFALAPNVMTTLGSARGKRSNIVLAPRMDVHRAAATFGAALEGRGFRRTDYRGEPIWKKGTGMMTAMQYVRVRVRGNLLGVSAWVMIRVGSADFCEMPLTGVVAVIPKKSLEDSLNAARAAIGC